RGDLPGVVDEVLRLIERGVARQRCGIERGRRLRWFPPHARGLLMLPGRRGGPMGSPILAQLTRLRRHLLLPSPLPGGGGPPGPPPPRGEGGGGGGVGGGGRSNKTRWHQVTPGRSAAQSVLHAI